MPTSHILSAPPDPDLPFLLERDSHRTLRLLVRPDATVLVRAPRRLPMTDIFRFLLRKRTWLLAKLAFFRAHPRPDLHRYEDGELFFYLGRPFSLRLIPIPQDKRLPAPRLSGQLLELPVHGEEDAPRALIRWRQKLAERMLTKRLRRLHPLTCSLLEDALPPPPLRVRSLKRRWGSCSARGEITLARQLSALPLPFVDYVIFHELCHLRRMDHSPAFHALLLRLLPDAPERVRALRLWSLEHVRE